MEAEAGIGRVGEDIIYGSRRVVSGKKKMNDVYIKTMKKWFYYYYFFDKIVY